MHTKSCGSVFEKIHENSNNLNNLYCKIYKKVIKYKRYLGRFHKFCGRLLYSGFIRYIGGYYMVEKKVIVKIPCGLHIRPAGTLSFEASRYKSKCQLVFQHHNINIHSLLMTIPVVRR